MTSAPAERAKVVLIEDDDALRSSLAEYLQDKGFEVAAAGDGAAGLAAVDEETAVVVTDLKLPGMSGLEVLKSARAIHPGIGVIVATGHGSIDTAVAAMREGAFHYVTKPINPTVLLHLVQEVVEKHRLRAEVDQLRAQLRERYGFDQIIGRSPAMTAIFDVIRHVAPTRATVLITGESGTGKELVARAIHQHSPRRERPFVAFNCAALPANLVESELFGHERGAFTGAVARRKGLLGAADGGTLFIDEVSELDVSLQAKLLRAIEERAYTPLGSTQEVKVDVRILAASNRDLPQAVAEGRFREDLYYRLKVVSLKLPPLRERLDDVPLLARAFLEKAVVEHGLRPLTLDPDAIRALQAWHWPGNVRELKNAVESAAVLARGDVIGVEDLPEPLGTGRRGARTAADAGGIPAGTASGADGLPNLSGVKLADLERSAILGTLDQLGGNRTRAARSLGISLRTLQRKLKEYGV